MKSKARPTPRGFTLIELMAVITIIIILAGVVVGGMSFVGDKQARETARVQVALLSKGIEEYKLDMGYYPKNSANGASCQPDRPGRASSATSPNGSGILYQKLFFEGYTFNKNPNAAQPSPPAEPVATRIYVAALDPLADKQNWVLTTGQAKAEGADPPAYMIIVDPWGRPYRYRSTLNVGGTPFNDTINPDFDLWSHGKDGNSNPSAGSSSKINADDVSNF